MQVVYHNFVTFSLRPIEYRFTSCTHTSSDSRH